MPKALFTEGFSIGKFSLENVAHKETIFDGNSDACGGRGGDLQSSIVIRVRGCEISVCQTQVAEKVTILSDQLGVLKVLPDGQASKEVAFCLNGTSETLARVSQMIVAIQSQLADLSWAAQFQSAEGELFSGSVLLFPKFDMECAGENCVVIGADHDPRNEPFRPFHVARYCQQVGFCRE